MRVVSGDDNSPRLFKNTIDVDAVLRTTMPKGGHYAACSTGAVSRSNQGHTFGLTNEGELGDPGFDPMYFLEDGNLRIAKVLLTTPVRDAFFNLSQV